MKPEDVKAALGDLPHMNLVQGRKLWDFLCEQRPERCLELGFFHGTSSAYIAAALEELGQGALDCIDLEYAKTLEPNIEQVLEKVGVRNRVQCYYEPSSYLWRLMRFLEESDKPRYDFCYLDGAHTWYVDGFAFLLVERLLRPGGWIVFDDLNWTYADYLDRLSPQEIEDLRLTLPDDVVDSMVRMPDELRRTQQVRKIYELLVKTHPGFDEFREEQGWAWARKSPDAVKAGSVRREVVTVRVREDGLAHRFTHWARRKLG